MPTFWSSLSPLRPSIASIGTNQCNTTTGNHAFFNGSTGCVQRVFDAGLLFFHLDFGRSADLDHGNTAGQLGNALLQLLAIVVGGGLIDLTH